MRPDQQASNRLTRDLVFPPSAGAAGGGLVGLPLGAAACLYLGEWSLGMMLSVVVPLALAGAFLALRQPHLAELDRRVARWCGTLLLLAIAAYFAGGLFGARPGFGFLARFGWPGALIALAAFGAAYLLSAGLLGLAGEILIRLRHGGRFPGHRAE